MSHNTIFALHFKHVSHLTIVNNIFLCTQGFWGWQDVADQVILMVPYIRRSMVEYAEILWDLGYPTEWGDPSVRQEQLYMDQPPVDATYEWRDQRVMDECHWYG